MKTCSHCSVEKPIEEFSWRVKSKGTRQSQCKECQKEIKREDYKARPRYYIDKAQRSKPAVIKRNKQIVIDHLRSHPCVDCGEDDLEVLELDHIERVGGAGSKGRVWSKMHCSVSTVLAELAKCEVRCANCHTRRTRRQMGWSRNASVAELADALE